MIGVYVKNFHVLVHPAHPPALDTPIRHATYYDFHTPADTSKDEQKWL